MTRWGMVAITGVAAFTFALVADAERLFTSPTVPALGLNLAGVLGAAFAQFSISWLVAGVAYLINRNLSRGVLVVTSIVASAVVAYFAYKGRHVDSNKSRASTEMMQKVLKETAESMRAGLPKRLDNNTTLIAVDSIGTTLMYSYQL